MSCNRDNCGSCIHCLDMSRFGGKGKMNQSSKEVIIRDYQAATFKHLISILTRGFTEDCHDINDGVWRYRPPVTPG